MADAFTSETSLGDSKNNPTKTADIKAESFLSSGVQPAKISFGSDFVLPYPNAPHDGGPQDQANTKAIVSQEATYNKYEYLLNNQPTFLDKLALGLNLGIATAGVGTVVGPAVSGAVGGGTAGTILGGAATGAAGGALTSAFTGTNLGKDVAIGAIGGTIAGGIRASGIGSALTDSIGKTGSNLVTGAVGSELTHVAASELTSHSGASGGNVSTPANQLAIGSPQTTSNNLGNPAAGAAGAAATFGSGVDSSLGGNGLLADLGSIAPYAAVGALGTIQASKGLANDKAYTNYLTSIGQSGLNQSNNLLSKYNSNTLNPQDKLLLDNANSSLATIAAAGSGLSTIAQQAFSNYATGTLPAWQQAELDAQVTSQKQTVAQNLESAGINDSTILASAYANIDNQALITKGNLLQQNFSTGTAAYDEYLKGTQEGQAILSNAVQTADTTLNAELNAALGFFGAGASVITNAIDTAMRVDAEYSAQMAQLYGTLAAAYAKQYQSKGTGGGGWVGSSLFSGAKSLFGGGGNSGGGGVDTSNPNTPLGDQNLATDIMGTTPTIDPSAGGDLGNITMPDVNTDFSGATDIAIG